MYYLTFLCRLTKREETEHLRKKKLKELADEHRNVSIFLFIIIILKLYLCFLQAKDMEKIERYHIPSEKEVSTSS